jgi:hypothetical protein
MPKLRAAVLDPDVSTLASGPLALPVQTEGKARFVEIDLEARDAVTEQAFRALAAHHQLGEPENVPDKPKPAAKATETAEKEQ